MVKKIVTALTLLGILGGASTAAVSQEEEISAGLDNQSTHALNLADLADCEGVYNGKIVPVQGLCDSDTCTEVGDGYKCLPEGVGATDFDVSNDGPLGGYNPQPSNLGSSDIVEFHVPEVERIVVEDRVDEHVERSNPRPSWDIEESHVADKPVVETGDQSMYTLGAEALMESMTEPLAPLESRAYDQEQAEVERLEQQIQEESSNDDFEFSPRVEIDQLVKNLNVEDYVVDGVLSLGNYRITLQEGEVTNHIIEVLEDSLIVKTSLGNYSFDKDDDLLTVDLEGIFDYDSYIQGNKAGCDNMVGVCVDSEETLHNIDDDGIELSREDLRDVFYNTLKERIEQDPIANVEYVSVDEQPSSVEEPVELEVEVLKDGNGNTVWGRMFGSEEAAVEQNYDNGEQSSSESSIRSIECESSVCNDSLDAGDNTVDNVDNSSQVVTMSYCDGNGCYNLEPEVVDSQVSSSRMCEGKDCLDEKVRQVAQPQEVPKENYEAAIDQAVVEPQEEQSKGDYVIPGNLISDGPGLSKRFNVSLDGKEYAVDINMSVLGNSVKGREGYVYPELMAKGTDTNRDGALSPDELSNMAQSDGCPICAETAERLYQAHSNGIEALTVEDAVGRAACNDKVYDAGFQLIPCVEQYEE
jgi:hypothetical protein